MRQPVLGVRDHTPPSSARTMTYGHANRLDHPARTRPIAADHPLHAPSTCLANDRSPDRSRPTHHDAFKASAEVNPAHQRFMRAPWTIARRFACGVVLENGRPNPPLPRTVSHQAAVLGTKWTGGPFPLSPTSLMHPLNQMGASGPAERRAQEPPLRGENWSTLRLGRPIHAQTRHPPQREG